MWSKSQRSTALPPRLDSTTGRSTTVWVLQTACLRLDLTRTSNNDSWASGTRLRTNTFNCLDNIHPLNNRAKNDVLSIQPRGIGSAQKELAAIGIRASVCLEGENNTRTVARNNFRELNLKKICRIVEFWKHIMWNGSAVHLLTILRIPGPVCFSLKFSSSNREP